MDTRETRDVGKQEFIILDYLLCHYAPEEIGRCASELASEGFDVEQVE